MKHPMLQLLTIGQGYRLHVDNKYTSGELFLCIYAAETIRKNREGFPAQLQNIIRLEERGKWCW
jgi:hypothetical protein